MVRVAFLWIVLIGLTACGGSGSAALPDGSVPADRVPVKAEVRPGFIELRRWREPRQRVVIDRAGASIGPVGEPLVRKLFVEPERLQDLLFFLRTYAPFQQRSLAGELAFGGQGPVKAGPVEQRMILEWARKVTAEVEGAPSDASYGLLLAWHRGEAAGSCDDVAVFLDGEVRASSCSREGESRGRLRPESLARLDQWYDRLKPFQQTAGVEAGRGRVPVRLIFAGNGSHEPSPEDVAALQSLAAALHRELTPGRGDAAPPQPAAPGTAAVTEVLDSDGAPAPEAPSPDLLVGTAPAGRLPLPQAALPEYIPPPPADDDDEAAPPPL
ncbi:MAG TPA: hypothetical protein VKM72_06770 [Thermoanaerobaculia bacterium]|nr:hypothetical protein [Thermoanaerobaculia bacterium]